jgi:hypothetical protein
MTLLDNPNFQFIDGISRLTMDVVLSGNLQGQNPCIEAEEELVRAAKQFSITATDPSMMIGQGRTVVNQFALSPDMAAARQPLSGLIGTIHEFIDESTATGKRPCLLIDDLGLLLNIGIDPRELHHFLSHLHLAMEKVCFSGR